LTVRVKIQNHGTRTLAIVAEDAMPGLEGLQLNCWVSGGWAGGGYRQASAPVAASTA
jgi:hypothetical protein